MKLEKIRPATLQEVEKIKESSDLTPLSQVLAMGDSLAVWRIANELDPFHFGTASNSQKYMFMWGLQNLLRGSGATEIYFNVAVADEHFRQVVETMGAEPVSKEPEVRYKITL